MLSVREVTKKTKTKAITRVKIGKKPKTITKQQKRVTTGKQGAGGTVRRMHSAQDAQCLQEPISSVLCYSFFLVSDLKS